MIVLDLVQNIEVSLVLFWQVLLFLINIAYPLALTSVFCYNIFMNRTGFIRFKTLLLNIVLLAILGGGVFLGYTLIKERKLFINEWFIGDGLRGVDISSYQGKVDMKSLANQGIRFVYMKATEGSNHVDETFDKNWTNITKTEMKAGAYHFFSFESGGETQADNYISAVGSLDGRLIPAVDVEIYGKFKDNPPKKEDVTKQLKIFMAVLEDKYKVKPMIYAQKDVYDQYLSGGFSEYPLWVRNVYFPVYLEFGGNWTIWQYKDRGELDGYDGEEKYIDLNVLNPGKKLDELIVDTHDD